MPDISPRLPEPAAATSRRKLTAIFHADVVGYSRLMGEDEAGTHARLMAYRHLMDDLISRRGGRIVNTAGDAVLADFPSVVDALSAAVQIQEALATENAPLPADRRLQFRIGINLGDVIVDGDDIFGDGVNVAARLESLAEPGGVAVSGAVYDQVRNKVGLAFRSRGAVKVKNIADPVKVFAVGTVAGAPPPRKPGASVRTLIGVVVAATAITLGGLYWFWNSPDVPLTRPAPASRATKDDGARIKGKPTIAVLPFVDRGETQKRAYFSDGITEDIISEFGRFSNLLVLSWNAVAPYKGKSVALDQLSRDLNVRYVVGGTVRQTGDQFVITVQLTDAQRGILLWSERYARSLSEIFTVQDEIARNVVAALSIRLTRLEQERVFRKATDSLDAYDHVLRGRSLMRRVERDANLDARKMFQKAIDSDPNYGVAYVDLGWSYMNDFLYGWSEWPIRALNRSRELAERAIRLDERNASAHGLLAQVLTFQREFKSARKEVEQAIRLNPNNATNHAIKGGLLMWLGDTDDAVSSLELALRLDPHPSATWVANLAQCYYFERRYKESIQLLERFSSLFKEDGTIFALLAAANGQLGQLEHASRALEMLRKVSPFFDAAVYAGNFVDHQNGEHFLEGLEKAGWKGNTGGKRPHP